MDLTQVFKASVMAVKLQRKIEVPVPDKNRILPPKGAGNSARDEFAKQAKDICHKITQLRNVLLENRGAYMKIAQHLKGAAHMTDEQRDLIDRESEKFVTYYTQHLAQLRADWKSAKRKPHHSQHMEAVFHLLEAYLKEVQTIYLEQKKYRVQHELETYRLLKLAADKKEIPVRPGSQTLAKKPRRLNSASSEEEKENAEDKVDEARNAKKRMDNDDSDTGSDIDLNDGWQDEATSKSQSTKESKNESSKSDALAKSGSVAIDEDLQKSLNDEQESHTLSPEDIQMYEQENVQLLHELQGLEEEVEQIEKNVVDIARLQDIFTEKVTLQQHNIDRIANAVVGATENVKDANEQIKQAIQRNAGLRVYILFFLLVMSFALLFLDWFYE